MLHSPVPALLMLSIVATALVWWRFRRVARQAFKLRVAADAIVGGDVLARANLSRGPLSPVGKSFDNMVEHVHGELSALQATQLELDRLVLTDRLTGLGNRRAFDQFVDREVAIVNRYGVPCSVIMFDVDHFKRINDAYGHSIGDQVLIGLARRISARLRDTDSIFRWGGEEFAIVTPCTPISGAQVLAESLRRAVAEQPFPTTGRVTISLGVAQLQLEETAAEWIARADRLLYDAKQQGRNCSRCSAEREDRSLPFILVWGEQFMTGNERIDTDHAEIFRLANELILLHPASNLDQTLARLDALLEHLGTHFATEEGILDSLGCVNVKRHAQQHLGLLAQAHELRKGLIDGDLDPFDLGDFIVRRVAIGHLVHADLPLFASLKQSEVIPVARVAKSERPAPASI